MKKAMLFKLSLLFASAPCLLHSYAQDSPQWGLPEGAKARLGKGSISKIQYSPDGTRLAVASSIGIWLYDTVSNQEASLFAGHTSVVSVAFSPDGGTIGSGDHTIRLWDTDTGKHRRTLNGHRNHVWSVAYSPDGGTIASGSWDDTIRLWNAGGKHLRTLIGHRNQVYSVSFSPDGRTLASGSRDGTVLLWELSSSTAFGVKPLAIRFTTLGNIKRTALLQNYPNPFNPETWIPYQLAKDAFVTLSIYDQSGHIVRKLDIGRQNSGVYRDRARAVYWDGRNQNGEPVTSGTYYYQLRAGDYTATRRMVIVK